MVVLYVDKRTASPYEDEPDTPTIAPLKGELMVRKSGLFFLTFVAILLVVTMNSQAQSCSTRHVREVVRNGRAKSVGRVPATQILQLNIVLPLSDQAGLHSFLRQL